MEQTPSNPPALEAIDVNVMSSRNQGVLVNHVNWKVQPGEYWVVGGAHGSGKTELLMTLAGLHRPAAGTVRIFGREMDQLPEGEMLATRLRIGFVFKGGGRMFTDLTVAENIALALCYHRNWSAEQAHAEVSAALELTGLASFAQASAQSLGSDWQQRVGLARAMVLKPEVLILDEPAAGLEPRHRQWWRNFLAELSAGHAYTEGRKMTVIAATNDFALWQKDTPRYALIKDNHWQILDEKEAALQIE